jgi:hypothetical protein
MTRPPRTPDYDETIANTDPPSATLETRYGALQLSSSDGESVRVEGWLEINDCRHRVSAPLHRSLSGRWQLGQPDEQPAAGEGVVGLYVVVIDRGIGQPPSSPSARKRAAVEITDAVNQWGSDPAHEQILREGAQWSTAFKLNALGTQIGELDREAASALSKAERLREEMAELAGTQAAAPGSQITLAHAVHQYLELLQHATHNLYGLIDGSASISEQRLLDTLESLHQLVNLNHQCANREQNPRLWDTLEALREAPRR